MTEGDMVRRHPPLSRHAAAAAAAKSLPFCQTLCDPINGSPPGSAAPGILQARTLEWVATSFSNAWKWKVKWSHSVVSESSRPHGLQSTKLLCPWDFPGKSIGMGRWTWVWINSGSWWWTGRPGLLRFTGLHWVRHEWATELNWDELRDLFKHCF